MLVQPFEDLPNLRVLPSGSLPPNPADLLESRETGQLIKALADNDGLVIIDAPPLNPVPDAQLLLSNPALDAAIVVARRRVSTRDGIRRARRILDRTMLQPLGVVVTGTTDTIRHDYGYAPEPVHRARAGTVGIDDRRDLAGVRVDSASDARRTAPRRTDQ